MTRIKKIDTLSCALNFCDFYPLINVNPIALERYLDSFSSFSGQVAIPMFLTEFIFMLETGNFSSSSNIIGVSLDVHRKSLTSYPISLIIDEKSIPGVVVEKVGPFSILSGSISLEDISIRSVVAFDHTSIRCIDDKIKSCGYDFSVHADSFDKFIKSSSHKRKYKVSIPSLNIDTEISSTSKEGALKSVLNDSWKSNDNRKFYKRRPSEYNPSTYLKSNDILSYVVRESHVEKTADASSGAGPDSSWTEGEQPSIKRDDYGRGFRDLPTISWLGRRVRFRSINESAVDNDGVIIYDKNNMLRVQKSNGAIVNLRKNDPHLFFTIDLI